MKSAGTCTKWEPNKELIKNIEDGTVKKQQYTKRMSKLKEDEQITLHEGFDVEDEESLM